MDVITLSSIIGLAAVIVITLGITGWMTYKVMTAKEKVKV
jgi:hypothetical protein